MTNTENSMIASQSSLAVHRFVYPSTVSMVDTGSRPRALSSGTLVGLGDRVFVATARHCVPPNPTGRLWIVPHEPRSPSTGMLAFIQFGRHPNLDLAFLELDRQSVTEFLPQHICCELSNLWPCGWGRANRAITICGTPVQFTEGQGTVDVPLNAVNIAFTTAPLTPSEFPTTPDGDRDADPATDIFFEYPTEGQRSDEGIPISLDSPEGFSGGGIWDQGFARGELWSPANAKLIGVQSSWHAGQRYSRGIQIIHWLRLLWSADETCRPQTEAAFPNEVFIR